MTTVKRCSTEKVLAKSDSSTNHACVWNIHPKKPKKWGFKVNARTGVSGLLNDFCFYEGKMPRVKKPSGCLSFDVVMKLCET
ncbi:hypothetical protein T03_5977, partial [Trichinella britovi]